MIAPGFIDAHFHSDVVVIENPAAGNRILQGITNEITGNCGFSPLPATSLNKQETKEECEINRIEFNKKKPAINVAPLVGHGNLRS